MNVLRTCKAKTRFNTEAKLNSKTAYWSDCTSLTTLFSRLIWFLTRLVWSQRFSFFSPRLNRNILLLCDSVLSERQKTETPETGEQMPTVVTQYCQLIFDNNLLKTYIHCTIQGHISQKIWSEISVIKAKTKLFNKRGLESTFVVSFISCNFFTLKLKLPSPFHINIEYFFTKRTPIAHSKKTTLSRGEEVNKSRGQ